MRFILALLLFGVVSCGSSDSEETQENNECGVCEIGERSDAIQIEPFVFNFSQQCVDDGDGCGEWTDERYSFCFDQDEGIGTCNADAPELLDDECVDGFLLACGTYSERDCEARIAFPVGSTEANAANCE